MLRAESQAGGIDSSYAAYFDDDQLTRITENRRTPRASQAEYKFTGARLIAYRGDAITAEQSDVDLSFDMKGAVTHVSKNVDAQEIAAIRNRAQLLRSLALARRSTMQHSESAARGPASASGAKSLNTPIFSDADSLHLLCSALLSRPEPHRSTGRWIRARHTATRGLPSWAVQPLRS